MDLTTAQGHAGRILEQMKPFCERCEIAGSIRRGKADGIKDVEVCVIPRTEERADPSDLFGEKSMRVNLESDIFRYLCIEEVEPKDRSGVGDIRRK